MACNGFLPVFQPQNPAKSGYVYGWTSCTAFAAAMAAAFDTCGKVRPTGGQVRSLTNEPTPDPGSPGLNLSQVDAALQRLGVDLDTRYRIPWAELERRVRAGQGCILQLSYAPIAASRFDAGRGFRGGHAVFVPPGFGVMDPLADGRAADVYRYHGEAYPVALLRTAAGRLQLGTEADGEPIVVGDGYAYAAFTRDQRSTWQVAIRPARKGARKAFYSYTVKAGKIVSRRVDSTTGFSATCRAPRLMPWPGHVSKSLVQITNGSREGRWVESRWAKEIP